MAKSFVGWIFGFVKCTHVTTRGLRVECFTPSLDNPNGLVRREPFWSFRIGLISGSTYTVHYPNQINFFRLDALLTLGCDNRVAVRREHVASNHGVHVADLTETTSE